MSFRRRRTLFRRIALGLAVAAIAAPAAQARFDSGLGVQPQQRGEGEFVGLEPRATMELAPNDAPAPVVPEPGAVSTPQASGQPSFDWTDAGIGAGVALGIVLLAGAAVATVRGGKVAPSV